MSKWYNLDNAAKLFPAVTTQKNTSIYRVSAIMKEEVVPTLLQQAVLLIADRFPMITMKIRQGFFWSYLEKNESPFKIQEDENYPCYSMSLEPNDRYLFRVLYFKNRISLEVFHMLTDGGGAMEYFKTLLWQYLKLCGKEIDTEGKLLLPEQDVKSYEMEDSFMTNYKPDVSPRKKTPFAYKITGTPFKSYGNNVIHGVLDAKLLNNYAKAQGVTITSFLTALLVYSINEENPRLESSKPVAIAIPVDFRRVFESKTLRNFVGAVNVSTPVKKGNSFADVLKGIDEDIKLQTEKENLQNIISNNVKFERRQFTRLIPAFIKNIAIGIGYNTVGARKKTSTLSNLGNIYVPEGMKQYIDSFEAILYPSERSPISCSVCSLNNKMVITFTRSIKEAEIIKRFFRYLTKECNLEVEIYSNDWRDEPRSEKAKRK